LGAVILGLVKTAAEEFDIAVDEGTVVNAHEYQDALGFVRVAQELTVVLSGTTNNKAAVEEIRGQLKALISALPSVVPPEKVETTPSTLYGAAAYIELAVLSL
jgi:hypothetical protein